MRVVRVAAAAAAAAAFLYLASRLYRRRRSQIPRLDVGRFVRGTAAERQAAAEAWDASFRDIGFCFLTGYESLLPDAVVAALRTEAEAFFSSLPAEKRRAHHDGFIGYLAVGAENVGASAGTPSALPDLVESLSLSGFQEAGQEWNWEEQKGAPWRDAPYARALPPALHRAAEEYWRGATALLRALMELSEVALDLPRGHFDASFARPGTLLRLAWYPPSPKTPEGQWRYGEHTDYDGFTILQRAEESAAFGGGLEIKMPNGEWAAVPAPAGTLTINIGDLLARWTNDRWRATPHRVAPPSGGQSQPRLSVVYFTGPHPDTLVERLPSRKCGDGTQPPLYAPITAREHVELKVNAACAAADG